MSDQRQILVDVTCDHPTPGTEAQLDWVGMESVEMPILWSQGPGQPEYLLPAQVDVYVSLDKAKAKGIHMSRLYSLLKESLPRQTLTAKGFKGLTRALVESQEGLSRSSRLKVSFLLPLEREALLSGLKGWRQYPVSFEGRWQGDHWQQRLKFEVLYSSTCPCSAALSQQAMQQHFLARFGSSQMVSLSEVAQWLGEEGSLAATAHAQRSRAQVELALSRELEWTTVMRHWIDVTEKALATPVQAAVKRQDEQEFARLNAANLMFCEDAARRLHQTFSAQADVLEHHIKVEHLESLHPHNAVAEKQS